VDHPLLVAAEVVREGGLRLLDRLRDAADVAVAEDPPEPGEEAVFDAVPLDVLVGQVVDDRLTRGEPNRCHAEVLQDDRWMPLTRLADPAVCGCHRGRLPGQLPGPAWPEPG
jgi:hypothetical protein